MISNWSNFKDTKNPVVVKIGGIDTTLTASQELVAAGTVQVATNAETAKGYTSSRSVTQTQHIIR